MKICHCGNPVFGKGFCRNHQFMRADFDKRSITQRGMDKHKEKSKKELVEDTTRQDIIAELDRVVSLYVRIRDANTQGIVQCYTCSVESHYLDNMQCGHYISRSNIGLRFDARNNCRTQCSHCNCYMSGNLRIYKENLEKENPGLPERLEEQARQVEHISITELDFLLREYKQKLSIIKQKLLVK